MMFIFHLVAVEVEIGHYCKEHAQSRQLYNWSVCLLVVYAFFLLESSSYKESTMLLSDLTG